MLTASDALVHLLIAAGRIRDLDAAVAGAVARARSLCDETDWRASAARAFHAMVQGWCTELVDLRAELSDLEDEVTRAAALARHRAKAMPVGAAL